MPDDCREVDAEVASVRAFVRERLTDSSLRRLATEIGVSHNFLDKFLGGARPRIRVWKLLRGWYLRTYVRPSLEDRIDPSALLDQLLGDLTGAARAEARVRMTSALAQGYKRMALPEPAWLFQRK